MRRSPRHDVRLPARAGTLLVTLALAAASCGGPFHFIPGGALRGRVVETPVADWSFVTDRWVHLETRPDDPYSVQVNYVVIDGALYLDASEGRRWLDDIRADPRVRVRFAGNVYPLEAVLVGRPGELEGFPDHAWVYRLEPRPITPATRP